MSGARICPRCSARVDERRARSSPFCLSCGSPIEAPTFAGKKASGSSALPLVLVGVAVVLLGFGGAIAFVMVTLSDEREPVRPGPTNTPPTTETASPTVAPLPTVVATVTSTPVQPPPPVTIRPPPPAITPPPPPLTTPVPVPTAPPTRTASPGEPAVCAAARSARARGNAAAAALEAQCRAQGGNP
jgi:hypothetical protein